MFWALSLYAVNGVAQRSEIALATYEDRAAILIHIVTYYIKWVRLLEQTVYFTSTIIPHTSKLLVVTYTECELFTVNILFLSIIKKN